MHMGKTTSKHPRIAVYIPQETLDALKKEAQKNKRSVNNQVIVCIDACLNVAKKEGK